MYFSILLNESFEKNPKGKQKFYRENLLYSFCSMFFQKLHPEKMTYCLLKHPESVKNKSKRSMIGEIWLNIFF